MKKGELFKLMCVLAGTFLLTGAIFKSIGPFNKEGEPLTKQWQQRRIIELDELVSSGPIMASMEAVTNPRFIRPGQARWLTQNEPVIVIQIDGRTRAYPLQILVWHGLVNDTVGSTPVLVSFCPFTYSTAVYDRRTGGRKQTFSVSGQVRYSNMVFKDAWSDSLWQQLTGRAVVGYMVGHNLRRIPSQVISFGQFREAYPGGMVMSRNTGFNRDYGRTPFVGIDDPAGAPVAYYGPIVERLIPMERVVGFTVWPVRIAYPYTALDEAGVINDQVGDEEIVVFHVPGALSVVDRSSVSLSREVGSSGVFSRELGGDLLEFYYEFGRIRDRQTGSVWDITGHAISGRYRGRALKPIIAGDYFAFAWLAFRPETAIYGEQEIIQQRQQQERQLEQGEEGIFPR